MELYPILWREELVRRYAARSDQDLATACAGRSDPYAYLALYSRHCAAIREQLEAAGLPRFIAEQKVGAVLDAVVSPPADAAQDGFSARIAAAVAAVVAGEPDHPRNRGTGLEAVGRQRLESRRPRLQVLVVLRRERSAVRRLLGVQVVQAHQRRGVAVWQRAQQDAVDHAEDGGVEADPQPRSRRRTAPVSSEVETLRQFFREEAAHTSLRGTARAAGLKRAALAKFVAGAIAEPNPRSLGLMRAFYLRHQTEAGERRVLLRRHTTRRRSP